MPDGDVGFRAPPGGGPIAEEQSFVVLSDGSMFCVYRTVAGYPACCYSRNGGHTWSSPDWLRYSDGRAVKNPRAANFIWKLSGDRYFYWFHNQSEKSYAHRNIVWCLGARESDSPEGKVLVFSQPEVLLYNDSITKGMSYPDLMELNDGALLVTETDKNTVRMHRIPVDFIERLFVPTLPLQSERIFTIDCSGNQLEEFDIPRLPIIFDHEPWDDWERTPNIDWRNGISIELFVASGTPPGILAENQGGNGRGFLIRLTPERKIEIHLDDPYSGSNWASTQILAFEHNTHVVIIIDGGPKIVSMCFNGLVDDGGQEKTFGFGRFNPYLHSLNGGSLHVLPGVKRVTLYSRALLISEVFATARP